MAVIINQNPVEIRAVSISEFEEIEATEIFKFVKERGTVKLLSYNVVKNVVNLDEVNDRVKLINKTNVITL